MISVCFVFGKNRWPHSNHEKTLHKIEMFYKISGQYFAIGSVSHKKEKLSKATIDK